MKVIFLLLGNLVSIIFFGMLIFVQVHVKVEVTEEQITKRNIVGTALALGVTANALCVLAAYL